MHTPAGLFSRGGNHVGELGDAAVQIRCPRLRKHPPKKKKVGDHTNQGRSVRHESNECSKGCRLGGFGVEPVIR
jgi:hypothetical protein